MIKWLPNSAHRNQNPLRIDRPLYTLLIILGLTASFNLSGCMKEPDLVPNYGPETSLNKIQEAINSDAPMNVLSIGTGQSVQLDETQVIDTQIPVLLSRRTDKITDFQDLPDRVTISFFVTFDELDLSTGKWKHQEFPQTKSLLKSNPATAVPSLQTLVPSISTILSQSSRPVSIASLRAKDAVATTSVTYHNLKRELGTMPIPEAVLSRPDCGGLPHCDRPLRFLKVSFDRVVWDNPKHGIKTSIQITYSPDIPVYIHDWDISGEIYFTNQFSSCAQTFLELKNGEQVQVVPVLQCTEVRDFQYPTPPQ